VGGGVSSYPLPFIIYHLPSAFTPYPLAFNSAHQCNSNFTLHTSAFILHPLLVMTSPSGQKYSLWFMPEGEVCERLTLILQQLSRRFEAPEFPPHVTVLGSCVGERDEMVRQSALVAAT